MGPVRISSRAPGVHEGLNETSGEQQVQATDPNEPTATDYLVVAAGASGLAFADSLIAEYPGAELVLVGRRPGPGGHWQDAYPFVRLHGPSAWYGVNSTRLGEDRIDESGASAGLYEPASGAEVLAY